MSDYIHQNQTAVSNFSKEKGWVILNEIEARIKQKIEAMGTPLKEWDVQINYGIKTGFNEAFIIDGQKRAELIEKCPKAAEIIRPILRGRDIKRYRYKWEDKWIIFTRRGIDIDEYPTIKKYLLGYYNELKPRNNGEVSGRKPGSYKWFEIQDNVAYFKDFEEYKIVWGNLALSSQFALVDKGIYINAPSAFIATENLYLLAILNSNIANFYIRQLGVTRNGGYFEYKPMFVEKLPIPKVSKEKERKIELLVKEIIDCKENELDSTSQEKLLDILIFDLYELSQEERQIIDFKELK